MQQNNDPAYIYAQLRTLLGGVLPVNNFEAAKQLIELNGDVIKHLFADAIGAVTKGIQQTMSAYGREVLKELEGLRTKAYLDSAGIPTIGYGNTYHPDGRKVKLGDVITVAQADEYLTAILPRYETAVHKIIDVPLTQHQFDALVCFVYNVGAAGFLNGSVDDKINSGDIAGAKRTWAQYNKVRNPRTKKLEVERGLNNRRIKELALFDRV